MFVVSVNPAPARKPAKHVFLREILLGYEFFDFREAAAQHLAVVSEGKARLPS